MRSRARFPGPARIATMPVAANTSPLPASAEAARRALAHPATPMPRKRRDAAPRSGYGGRVGRAYGFGYSFLGLRGVLLMAGYA
jgi:hypothetical protein